MKKPKLKWSYLIYIAALSAAIFLTSVTIDNILLQKYLKNGMHYEAWDLVYNNPLSFVLCTSAKDDGIKFFDVMATHKTDESNKISGEWTLPDFKGWSCAEVACALKNIGQPYEVLFIEAPEMQHNVVVKQEPAFGESVSKDYTVVLYANSAYGKEITSYYFPLYTGTITECGEWLILEEYNDIYKCHTDFSDKEKIYECINDFSKAIISINAHENTIYFTDSTNDYKEEIFYLISLSLDGRDSKILYESDRNLIISDYYDDTLYFFKGGEYSLKTNEFVDYETETRSIIYNDMVYSFTNEKLDEAGEYKYNYECDLFISKYGNYDSSNQHVMSANGIIRYVVPYKNILTIGFQGNNGEEKIYVYNSDTNEMQILAEETYTDNILRLNTIIFNENLFILSAQNYDYVYSLDTLQRKHHTIITKSDSAKNFSMSVCRYGNYLFPQEFIYREYIYNMITDEYEKVDSFESPEKREE
ncbi:MAG: hypothetical protein AB1Z23_01760 [Eubacteriales bacterium]